MEGERLVPPYGRRIAVFFGRQKRPLPYGAELCGGVFVLCGDWGKAEAKGRFSGRGNGGDCCRFFMGKVSAAFFGGQKNNLSHMCWGKGGKGGGFGGWRRGRLRRSATAFWRLGLFRVGLPKEGMVGYLGTGDFVGFVMRRDVCILFWWRSGGGSARD